jgi:hypothetical protein
MSKSVLEKLWDLRASKTDEDLCPGLGLVSSSVEPSCEGCQAIWLMNEEALVAAKAERHVSVDFGPSERVCDSCKGVGEDAHRFIVHGFSQAGAQVHLEVCALCWTLINNVGQDDFTV